MIKKIVFCLTLLIAISPVPVQADWRNNVNATVTGVATACAGIGASTSLIYLSQYIWKYSSAKNPAAFYSPPLYSVYATYAAYIVPFVTPFIAHEIAERCSSKEEAQRTGYKAAMVDCATIAALATASTHVNPLPIFFYRAILPSFFGLYKLQPKDHEDTE